MHTKEGYQLEIRRLYHLELQEIQALMFDVISRLPFQDLFAMDDENGFLDLFNGQGEIYGAFNNGTLVAYSVLAFPGVSESNLGSEFGVLEVELPLFTRPMYGGKNRHCYSKRLIGLKNEGL